MNGLNEIAMAVSAATGYGPAALRSRERTSRPVTARMLFCWLARKEGHTLHAIGAYIGHNHSTVLQSARTFGVRLECKDRMAAEFYSQYELFKSKGMSKVVEMLEITPDRIDNRPERFTYGFVCPRCGGRGWTRNWEARRDESDGLKCERCDGSGRLTATVAVDWTAGK
jgi:predicted RNA-binding Zn-ribbon protein involved in translation (DUF1610 family)